jgi:hypothetical protein
MKKLAIFVEGQTEQLFVCKLVREIAGDRNIAIRELKPAISNRGNRYFTVLDASSADLNKKYYVLIFDSGGDSQVKSDILDNYATLVRQNYHKIIGLRDVYHPPMNRVNIPQLEYRLKYRVPTSPISVSILLAMMEVEAWFLAETTHFAKIHSSLTLQVIKQHLNFDPTTQDVETRDRPSNDLDSVYHLASFAYNKRKANCMRTVDALDYHELYLILSRRVNRLGKFIQELDAFLS